MENKVGIELKKKWNMKMKRNVNLGSIGEDYGFSEGLIPRSLQTNESVEELQWHEIENSSENKNKSNRELFAIHVNHVK